MKAILPVLIASILARPHMLLYAGPDQFIPIASFVGAIIGVLLIGWQRFVSLLRRIVASLTQKLRPSDGK